MSPGQVRSNPPVDPVPFGHWTLRDEAAQRRSPARWASRMRFARNCILTLLACLSLGACGEHSYTFQMWAYPETIKPHESGWSYLGQTTFYDEDGVSPTEPIMKKCVIAIVDRNKRELLHDVVQVFGGTFETKVEWKEASLVRVRIFGDTPATTAPVFDGQYRFDGSVFRRVDAQPIIPPDAAR